MSKSKAPTFRVVKGGRRELEANMIVEQSGGPTPHLFAIEIGYYPYGCEGEGHFIETSLTPGLYKIIKVSE